MPPECPKCGGVQRRIEFTSGWGTICACPKCEPHLMPKDESATVTAKKEPEHTPGPWTLEPCTSGGMLVYRKGCLQDYLQIVPEADARLIAAAPELLAACEDAFLQIPQNNHHFAETGEGSEGLYQQNGMVWVKLRDVLMRVHGAQYVDDLREKLQKAKGEE